MAKNYDSKYLGLRQQTVDIKPEDLFICLDKGKQHQVYAAVVDMPIKGSLATLTCTFDGTVSIYFSDGAEILGASSKSEEVKNNVIGFLYSAGQVISFMDKVDTCPLPENKDTIVYLKCGEGTYSTHYDMNVVQTEKYKSFLNFLIQRVVKALSESGLLKK